MNKQLTCGSLETSGKKIAIYFGLPVQVIDRMPHCSLIRYRDREFIVNTGDLHFEWSLKCAA
jgi:hypothetical protein